MWRTSIESAVWTKAIPMVKFTWHKRRYLSSSICMGFAPLKRDTWLASIFSSRGCTVSIIPDTNSFSGLSLTSWVQTHKRFDFNCQDSHFRKEGQKMFTLLEKVSQFHFASRNGCLRDQCRRRPCRKRFRRLQTWVRKSASLSGWATSSFLCPAMGKDQPGNSSPSPRNLHTLQIFILSSTMFSGELCSVDQPAIAVNVFLHFKHFSTNISWCTWHMNVDIFLEMRSSDVAIQTHAPVTLWVLANSFRICYVFKPGKTKKVKHGTANRNAPFPWETHSQHRWSYKWIHTNRPIWPPGFYHLSATMYGWVCLHCNGRNFITEMNRPKLCISLFWYSSFTMPDK